MSQSGDPTPSSNLTRCRCVLEDCYYFNLVTDDPYAAEDACDCSHPDKPFHMGNPCPLYRKNWKGGKEQDLKDLQNRFLRRRQR